MKQLTRWVRSGKFPAMRVYLHVQFILVIMSLEGLFKSLYVRGYQFEFQYQYSPVALLFYAFYLSYVYCTAFLVLSAGRQLRRTLRILLRIFLLVCTYCSFIPVRYLLEQILVYKLFGVSNYPQSTTWAYYFHDNLGIAFTVVLAGFFVKFMDDWFVTDRRKSVLERENLRLELDFLKSQLNPHFLFNTLNNVQSYIVQDEKRKSIELIGRLSGFMRFALYECNEEYIALDKEISILQDYVELERVRCDDRTTITFTTAGHFNNYVIPPMLLMPFIENAFKHGADRQLQNSWINVAIRQQNNQLELQVENNFTGMTVGNGGIGLRNVQRRLEHYFNHRHQLVVSAVNNVYKVRLTLELE
jgi:two-component system, LytTR family, sensor kinase